MRKRDFLTGLTAFGLIPLTGCSTTEQPNRFSQKDDAGKIGDFKGIYGARTDGGYSLPAIDLKKVPKKFWRRQVNFPTRHPVGTVVVNTKTYFLHLVQENGKAMRYGVGLGRQGFEWSGDGVIQWKRKWPTWTPPDEMIARQPELEKWSSRNGGMPPGLSNPLGARALYIFQNGEDTLYRIHGSPEFWTIGKSVSSGCVRMINQDVIDLYDRVPNKSRLVVI